MKGLTTDWNFVRLLRLVPGVAILVQGFFANNIAIMVVGGLFVEMAVANIGYCGAKGCTVPTMFKNKTGRINSEELDHKQ